MNKEIKSLYRVHRPKTFAQVIGQDHITKTLQNQISSGKVTHAYLFCGTRGTGKTSVAKIFAREVNTGGMTPPDIFLDIFEIDAASNNSVQDVRDLIDKVKYPPVHAKYKVYIIDEVHMFSGAAFNAFLKTLEKPPSHVIFILCTTEPHKLLPTVQSRCLRFDFRSVATAEIEKHLAGILKKEKIDADPAAIKLLAEAGSGSVRDAMSFTETTVAYCGQNKITAQDVATVLGTVDRTALISLLDAITKKETQKITKQCTDIFSKGINTNVLVKDFLTVIRQTFMETKNPVLLYVYKIFAELEMNIKTAPDAATMFEGACFLAHAQNV